MIRRVLLAGAAVCLLSTAASAGGSLGVCAGLPNASALQAALTHVTPNTSIGGLFDGGKMWAAVVDRAGRLCAVASNTSDVWPGSQAIAKAKAYTANAFSVNSLALSTARLYTFTQPGHSLWSLGQSNLFDSTKGLVAQGDPSDKNKIDGGLIFFGGGLPLYSGGVVVGGLGISGDTSCADHEVAKLVRGSGGLNMAPPGGNLVDDIQYSAVDGASVFTHPQCLNTKRNGTTIGTENPSSGY